jgi:hypothetical protein
MFIAARSPAARVGFANVSALLRVRQLWDRQVEIYEAVASSPIFPIMSTLPMKRSRKLPFRWNLRLQQSAPASSRRTEAVQSAYGRLTSIRAIRSLATSVRSGSCRRARRIIPGRQRPLAAPGHGDDREIIRIANPAADDHVAGQSPPFRVAASVDRGDADEVTPIAASRNTK